MAYGFCFSPKCLCAGVICRAYRQVCFAINDFPYDILKSAHLGYSAGTTDKVSRFFLLVFLRFRIVYSTCLVYTECTYFFNTHKRINTDVDFGGYLFDCHMLFDPALFNCAAECGIINFIKSIERIMLVVIHFESNAKQGSVFERAILNSMHDIRIRQ